MSAIFGECEKIWRNRLKRLEKEYNWLSESKNIMTDESKARELIELESEIYHHKVVLREFEKKKT